MYIYINKALFAKLRTKKLAIVRTGGGPIQPQGIGIIKFKPYTGTVRGRP